MRLKQSTKAFTSHAVTPTTHLPEQIWYGKKKGDLLRFMIISTLVIEYCEMPWQRTAIKDLLKQKLCIVIPRKFAKQILVNAILYGYFFSLMSAQLIRTFEQSITKCSPSHTKQCSPYCSTPLLKHIIMVEHCMNLGLVAGYYNTQPSVLRYCTSVRTDRNSRFTPRVQSSTAQQC